MTHTFTLVCVAWKRLGRPPLEQVGVQLTAAGPLSRFQMITKQLSVQGHSLGIP